MYRSTRTPVRVLLASTIVAIAAACGGSDESGDAEPADTESQATESQATDATLADEGSEEDGAAAPDPVAVEACLEAAGLQVRNQDEVDSPYTAEQLDFFDLDTELLVEGGDTEFITGSINFYRTLETAEEQEVTFEESVTDYTVGRTGTVVYTLVGGTDSGEVDTVAATIDGCLAEG
jgi:zona occludens toxin (predicted ATPase)